MIVYSVRRSVRFKKRYLICSSCGRTSKKISTIESVLDVGVFHIGHKSAGDKIDSYGRHTPP